MDKPKNNQEVLDEVRKQFSRPFVGFGHDAEQRKCLYNKDYLHRCGIGCVLPNHLLNHHLVILSDSPSNPGKTINDLLLISGEFADFFENCDRQFLTELQTAHDDAAEDEDMTKTDFVRSLDKVALNHGLR